MKLPEDREPVRLNLTGVDGNAFAILGAFSDAASRQGWSRDDIKTIIDEATDGDYDHLLQTIVSVTR